MVQVIGREILIDGIPSLILSGEVHYFRLRREDWEDRIVKAKEAGIQAVASYIPWLIHQEDEEEIDLEGRLAPENNIGAFIDLCAAHDLLFIARPGPFVMAEMKNEGVPYWVYRKRPEAVPVTWEGESVGSKTLDYLHPGYLEDCRRWYEAVIPVLAQRSRSLGGPVIGVQLDNEVGMLSWVRNEPDLTDIVLADFARTHGSLSWTSDPAAWRTAYCGYQRERFARYFEILKGYAREFGWDGPLFLNIHGTGGGRATTFPVGISQLLDAMKLPEMVSGTDHYLGDITRDNFQDLWYMDAFTLSATPGPLTAMEFEAGSGDYGDSGARRVGGDAADIKAKLGAVKGNRITNSYLLTGGRNRLLRHPAGDGNDRIAFTGERHGFTAPINPEGLFDPSYGPLQATYRAIGAAAPVLADSHEVLDDMVLAFIPDAYATDYHRPGIMSEIVRSLEEARPRLESMLRGLLYAGVRPGCVNLQDPGQEITGVLALASSRHMAASVQQRIVDRLASGGRLLLIGEPPVADLEGRPCTLLIDALGITVGERLESQDFYFVSATPKGILQGMPEFRLWYVREVFGGRPLLGITGRESHCAVETDKAVILACDYAGTKEAWSMLASRLGVKPSLSIECEDTGVFGSWCQNERGEKAAVFINLDRSPKAIAPEFAGWGVLPPFELGSKEARLLLMDASLDGVDIAWSTVELARRTPQRLEFAASEGIIKARLSPAWIHNDPLSATDEEGWTIFTVHPAEPLVFERIQPSPRS